MKAIVKVVIYFVSLTSLFAGHATLADDIMYERQILCTRLNSMSIKFADEMEAEYAQDPSTDTYFAILLLVQERKAQLQSLCQLRGQEAIDRLNRVESFLHRSEQERLRRDL